MVEGEKGIFYTTGWQHYKSLEDFFLPLSQEDLKPLSDSSELYKLGYLNADIVGIQSYNCSIDDSEIASLVRETRKLGDPNAIKVLNMGMIQVGYIEGNVAEFLAPYMDSNLITVGGIVTTENNASDFKIPCKIYIFTKMEFFVSLKLEITRMQLKLVLDDNELSSSLE